MSTILPPTYLMRPFVMICVVAAVLMLNSISSQAQAPAPPGKNAQTDFAGTKLVDVLGNPINDITYTYLPGPHPLYSLAYSRESGRIILLPALKDLDRVLIKHADFELVARASELSFALARKTRLPVVINGQKAATVTGRVVDDEDKPVQGALVWLSAPAFDPSPFTPQVFVRTDSQGKFTIAYAEFTDGPVRGVQLGVAPNKSTGLFPVFAFAVHNRPLEIKLKKNPIRKFTLLNTAGKPYALKQPQAGLWIEWRDNSNYLLSSMLVPASNEIQLPDGWFNVFDSEEFSATPLEVQGNLPAEISFQLLKQSRAAAKRPKSTMPIAVQVTITDVNGYPIKNKPFCILAPDGKWIDSGRTDDSGKARVAIPKLENFTIGVRLLTSPEQDPRLRAVVVLHERQSTNTSVRLSYNAWEERMIDELRTLQRLAFQDALGNPLPQGTLVTLPADPKPITLTLDAAGTVDAKQLADAYRPGFKVSHPDYGSAVVNQLWDGAKSSPIRLPLVSNTDSKDPLVVAGIVLGPDGKPAPNVAVLAGFPDPRSSAPPASQLKSRLTLALTNPDGSFRVRTAELSSQEAQNRETQPQAFTAVPQNRRFMPWDGVTTSDTKLAITLRKADRDLTLTFHDQDGQPASISDYAVTATNDAGQTLFTAPPGWLDPSGKTPLADGTYVFHNLKYNFTSLLSVDAQTPLQSVVAPDAPLTLVGTVNDAVTGKTLSGVLFLVVNGEMHHTTEWGALPPASLLALNSLKNPITVPDGLPEELKNTPDLKRAFVTDELGQYRFQPRALLNGRWATRFFVYKHGYVPVEVTIQRPDKATEGILEQLPIKLTPAGYIDISFPPGPDGKPRKPVRFANDAPYCAIYFDIPGQPSLVESIEEFPDGIVNSITKIDLPFTIELQDRKLILPAGIPIRFQIRYQSNEAGINTTQRLYYELPDGPVTLKPGEIRKAILTAKPIIRRPHRFVSPTGTPLNCSWVNELMLSDSDRWNSLNTYSDDQGVFDLPRLEGKPLTLGIQMSRTMRDGIRLELPPITNSGGIVDIKLTQEQFDILSAKKIVTIAPPSRIIRRD